MFLMIFFLSHFVEGYFIFELPKHLVGSYISQMCDKHGMAQFFFIRDSDRWLLLRILITFREIWSEEITTEIL